MYSRYLLLHRRQTRYRREVARDRPLPAGLPAEELIAKGIADLGHGTVSVEALLVSIGAQRLTDLGLTLPEPLESPEHRLYERLHEEEPDSAHGRYNAYVRRLVSFERAAECASNRLRPRHP